MSNPDSVFLRAAVRACRAAGRIQRAAFGAAHAIEHKGEIDLVTRIDKRSEAAILKVISGAFPSHGILAEEGGATAGDGEHLWVIDPLDGTTNYSRGFPVFCSSVALAREGRVVVGAIYQPLLDELFTAVRGRGAFLNGVRLRVSPQSRLDQAFLATGFPYDIRRSRRNNIANFSRFATRCLAVRRAGAAALDLAYIAAGRFDGFWELKLRPWDIAAASLMIEEAGGRITGTGGRPWRLGVRDVVASNGLVHGEMLGVLHGPRGAARKPRVGRPGGTG
ncbi:MAG TPA: inositol monophosphatase family protein [Candidatus Methanoperedens sp.]|nr:inositol monophosphatase family protein [Candidatus Methanoperedens sp.]